MRLSWTCTMAFSVTLIVRTMTKAKLRRVDVLLETRIEIEEIIMRSIRNMTSLSRTMSGFVVDIGKNVCND